MAETQTQPPREGSSGWHPHHQLKNVLVCGGGICVKGGDIPLELRLEAPPKA